jgi:hypothetical protein
MLIPGEERRKASIVIGPADRGICTSSVLDRDAFDMFFKPFGGLPPMPPDDPVCIGQVVGKEALTKEPAACNWLEPWLRFLREDRHIDEAYLQRHIRVKSWDIGTRGAARVIAIQYDFVFDWVTVPMEDSFTIREAGAAVDRTEADFLAELRAHRSADQSGRHAWILRPIRRIVPRSAVGHSLKKCDADNLGPVLGIDDEGTPTAVGFGSVDYKARACPRGSVNLETGATECRMTSGFESGACDG